jgi:hypothetical protein
MTVPPGITYNFFIKPAKVGEFKYLSVIHAKRALLLAGLPKFRFKLAMMI